MKRGIAIVLYLLFALAVKPEFPLRGLAVGAVAVGVDQEGRANRWLTLIHAENPEAPWEWVVVLGQKDGENPAVPAGVRIDAVIAKYRVLRPGHPEPYPGPPRVRLVRARIEGKGELPKSLGEAAVVRPCPRLPELPPPLDRIGLACEGKRPPLGRSGEALAYLLKAPFFGERDPLFGEAFMLAWIQEDHALVTAVGSELALFFALPKDRLPPPSRAVALASAPRLASPLPPVARKSAVFRLEYPYRRYLKAHDFRLAVTFEGLEGGLARYRVERYDLLGDERSSAVLYGAGAFGPHYLNPDLPEGFAWAFQEMTWRWEAGNFAFGFMDWSYLEGVYQEDGGLHTLVLRSKEGEPAIRLRRLP